MSCNRFVEAWGGAEGPVKRLRPTARLATGVLLFAAVLVHDPATTAGLSGTLLIVSLWFMAVQPPGLLLRPLFLFAFILFAPFFLLTPWIDVPQDPGLLIPVPWAVPWRIVLRGMAALFVSAWTASTLALPELESALFGLHTPKPLAELLLQIVHQAHALVEETKGILQAIRVREAATGWRVTAALALALPQVWLPRVLYRSERIGDAMDLRGYEMVSAPKDAVAVSWKDRFALVLGVAAFFSAVGFRWVGA